MLGMQVGPYRISRLLGEGGMGAVYEAVNDSIERRVAIKVLHQECARQPEVVARFFNEARAANRINHPSMVQIHELGSLPDKTAYIVMEYLDGVTLAKCLQVEQGPLDLHRALQYCWQIAAALAEAHAKGIVHRDLKPANVMLIRDALVPGGERVKILDFGIAKLATDARHGKTASHILMGTPSYMSPEQCRGAGTVDEKSDVYSLGILMFLVLSGRLPFDAEGAGELIVMHLHLAPPSLAALVPGIPPVVAALVHRLLEKDRQLRPVMREVERTLESMLKTEAVNKQRGQDEAVISQRPVRSQLRHLESSTTLALSTGQPASGRPAEPRVGRRRALVISIGALCGVVAGGMVLVRRTTAPGLAVNTAASEQSRRSLSQVPEPKKLSQPATLDSTKDGNPTPLPTSAVRSPLANAAQIGSASADLETVFPSAIGTHRATVPNNPSPPTKSETGSRSRKQGAGVGKRSSAEAMHEQFSHAETLLAGHRWQAALTVAQNPELVRFDPQRAWTLVGHAACMLRETAVALEAFGHADKSSKSTIAAQCASNGIFLNGGQPAGLSSAAAALLQANAYLQQQRYSEAIALARPHTVSDPQQAWEIIGLAACRMKAVKFATQARRAVNPKTQQLLDGACNANGVERVEDTYNIRVQ